MQPSYLEDLQYLCLRHLVCDCRAVAEHPETLICKTGHGETLNHIGSPLFPLLHHMHNYCIHADAERGPMRAGKRGHKS